MLDIADLTVSRGPDDRTQDGPSLPACCAPMNDVASCAMSPEARARRGSERGRERNGRAGHTQSARIIWRSTPAPRAAWRVHPVSFHLSGRPPHAEGGENRAGMTDAPTEQPQHGAAAAAISNLTVHLLSEYIGAARRARTHLSGDLVAVVLRDTMTRGERSLVDHGEHDRVLDTRQAFQRVMREELAAGVTKITGREVVAFMSANHIDPDMGVEVFILAPGETPAQGRLGLAVHDRAAIQPSAVRHRSDGIGAPHASSARRTWPAGPGNQRSASTRAPSVS